LVTLVNLFLDVAFQLAAFSFFCLVMLGLEWLNPADRIFDGPSVLRNYVVGYFFLFAQELANIGLGLLLAHSWHGLIALGRLEHGSYPRAIALALPVVLTRDLFYYWFHRLQHSSKWLWPQHALHHSDEHVNATTTFRHHWLEMPLTAIFVYWPLALLFDVPVLTFGIAASIHTWITLGNHVNIRIGLGKFGWLISCPQTHRIHHSSQPEHTDKNFAATFTLWDVIFGTYYQAGKAEYPATGLSSGERVTSTRQALLLPFTMWRKMLSKGG
jgi:sterol desaturase/sphingolipid hydroxylase (fatty acid hydroxylase superfamily)